MTETELNDLLAQLAVLDAEFEHRPFPYRDVFAACDKYGDALYDLSPNVNSYTMGVSGLAWWGLGLLQWEKEIIDRKVNFYSKSFFERFPQYAILQELLANGFYPDLNFELENAEKQRKIMLVLLKEAGAAAFP